MKLYYENDGLKHASFKKKYVAKLPVGNGKYRYFYSKEEYDAFTNRSYHDKIRNELKYDTKKEVIPRERRGGVKDYRGKIPGSTRTFEENNRGIARYKYDLSNDARNGKDAWQKEFAYRTTFEDDHSQRHSNGVSAETKKKQKRINRRRKFQKSLKKIGINWDW